MSLPIVRTDYKLFDIISSIFNLLAKKTASIEELEEILAKLSYKKYSVFFPQLRYGMKATFEVSMLPGSFVGVPTYTCSVVPHSVVMAGCNVDFNDCNKKNLTTEIFKSKKNSANIVTPWYGSPLDRNISYEKITFGDFSHVNILNLKHFLRDGFDALFFSFSPGKPISSVGGGLVATDNEELYKDLKK